MDQLGRLRLDRRNDLGWTVTHREDADAADQADQRVGRRHRYQRTLSALDGEWCRLVESLRTGQLHVAARFLAAGPGSRSPGDTLVEVVSIQASPEKVIDQCRSRQLLSGNAIRGQRAMSSYEDLILVQMSENTVLLALLRSSTAAA